MAARKPAVRTTHRPAEKSKKPSTTSRYRAARTATATARKATGAKRELLTREDAAPAKKVAVELTGKQRRQLRALGHHLEPIVIVGHQGVTDGVIAAVEQALHDHELIKVKINEGPAARKDAAAQVADATGSALAQVLGRTALLYRPHPEDPQIEL